MSLHLGVDGQRFEKENDAICMGLNRCLHTLHVPVQAIKQAKEHA